MEKLQLRSERLILRPHRKEDLPALFECFSDTEAMKYWSSAPHTSLQQTEAKIEEWSRVTPGLELVIEFESETIGRCGYFDSDLGHEIGYLLNRKHWGKGKKNPSHPFLFSFSFFSLSLFLFSLFFYFSFTGFSSHFFEQQCPEILSLFSFFF